jgi:hypothetical protein
VERSKRRHKARARTLALWERELERALIVVRQELGLARDEVVADEILIGEVLALADPWAIKGRDAAIPAPRVDLASRWFTTRLRGGADSEAERTALARRLAPSPDPSDEPAGRQPWGVTRHAVERAVIYCRKRAGRAEE